MTNYLQTTTPSVVHQIKVKDYMTKPTMPGSSFDFMEKWNNNVPMPTVYMTGTKKKETNGMVFMEARESSPPFSKWTGWIIKSAILSDRELSSLEAEQFKKRVEAEYSIKITIQIYRNRLKNIAMRIWLSKQNNRIHNLLCGSFGAKQRQDWWYYTPIKYFEDILEEFKGYNVVLSNPENWHPEDAFIYDTPPLITGYPIIPFKSKLYNHQIEAYHFGMQRNAFLIADDQGLGKSLESITIAVGKKEMYGYRHCLVICGVNSLKWNWVNEISTHSNETGYVLGQRKKRNGRYRSAGNKEKLADLENIQNIPDYFLITNIETLRNKKILEELQSLTKRGEISAIIIDEFHKAKNASTKQGENILSLSADTKIALTGTPILNSPLDAFAALKWLGYEKNSKTAFADFYTNKKKVGYQEVVTFKHMHILRNNLEKIMLRRVKEDVIDLPDKVFKNEYLEMSEEQQKIYDEVYNNLVAQIDEIELSPNPLAKMIRLRQATAHCSLLSSMVSASVKMERLHELVEDALSNNQKVIVFSNWAEVCKKAQERLFAFNPEMVIGSVKEDERMAIMERFQGTQTNVVIGTIPALGTGFTLNRAEVVIFLDEPWTDGNKRQAIDRAHRIGTQKTVFVYTLICKDTIDERVNMLVETKKEIANYMVDGQLSNKSLARFLLGLEAA